jgi:hypothetical protein
LTPAIALWRFGSASGLQLPKWSSFGSVRVHSLTLCYTPGSMKCASRSSLLAYTLVSPCFGRELTKVATGTLGCKLLKCTNGLCTCITTNESLSKLVSFSLPLNFLFEMKFIFHLTLFMGVARTYFKFLIL